MSIVIYLLNLILVVIIGVTCVTRVYNFKAIILIDLQILPLYDVSISNACI